MSGLILIFLTLAGVIYSEKGANVWVKSLLIGVALLLSLIVLTFIIFIIAL